MRKYLVVIAFCLLAAGSPSADTLFLRDGDRLTGTLVHLKQGTVSFRTRLAGKLFIPADEVRGLSTEQSVFITTAEGRLVPGRLEQRGDQLLVRSLDGRDERPMQWAQIREITTVPSTPEPQESEITQPPDPRVGVSLSTGIMWSSGSQDNLSAFSRLELLREGPSTAFAAYITGQYTINRQAFDHISDAGARILFGEAGTWRPSLTLEFERNLDRALEFRADLTVGVNRRFVQTADHELEGGLGLGLALERYDAEPLLRSRGRTLRRLLGSESESEEEINLNLNLRYSRTLFKRTAIEEALVIRPSLSDLGELRAQWRSVLSVPLTSHLDIMFDILLDYEDDTKFRAVDPWRTTFGASVRLNF